MALPRGRADARPTQLRPRKRDQDVLNAAVKVFHRRGYSGATVQDIADELGILKGSLYHYIRTKEDLLFRLCEMVHRDVDALMTKVKAVDGLTPLERIRLFAVEQVTYNLSHLPLISVYHHDLERLSDERRGVVTRYARENTRWVTQLIREAQELGEADPAVDAALLANFAFAPIVWTYRWYRPDRGGDVAAIAETCAAYVVGGIAGPVAAVGR